MIILEDGLAFKENELSHFYVHGSEMVFSFKNGDKTSFIIDFSGYDNFKDYAYSLGVAISNNTEN